MQEPQQSGKHSDDSGPTLRLNLSGQPVGPSGPEPGQPIPGVSSRGSGKRISRRWFLMVGTATGAAVAAAFVLESLQNTGTVSSQASVILANAQGVLIADPTRCVGCRRCELACTEYNKGKSQPTIANIKIARNLNFGPKMASVGYDTVMGIYGNHRVIHGHVQTVSPPGTLRHNLSPGCHRNRR